MSGLGADERAFQSVDFSGYSTTYIRWIIPIDKETIEHYTARLLDQIRTEKPILIGLSFGGLIAIEIAKQIETEKVIIISSCKTKNEVPFYLRFAGQVGLHKLLPASLLKSSNILSHWFFGTSSIFDIQILNQMLFDTNPIFLKWAIEKVLLWKNQTLPKNIFHIHGTKDRLLPLKFVNCQVNVKNGGHFMILNKADELNKILRQEMS